MAGPAPSVAVRKSGSNDVIISLAVSFKNDTIPRTTTVRGTKLFMELIHPNPLCLPKISIQYRYCPVAHGLQRQSDIKRSFARISRLQGSHIVHTQADGIRHIHKASRHIVTKAHFQRRTCLSKQIAHPSITVYGRIDRETGRITPAPDLLFARLIEVDHLSTASLAPFCPWALFPVSGLRSPDSPPPPRTA